MSLKRIFDVGLTLLALPAIVPLALIVAGFVRVKLGSPVLFRQARPGLGGEEFELMKFRTMTDDKDAKGALLPDEDRLTPFGARLRRTSLDELPTLLNVLRGDMSLVGPRPLRMEYLERYSSEQARRHEVLPGVTGWAQVNGRNALAWNQKFALDVQYVEMRSMRLDIKILWLTVREVLTSSGISADDHATAPEFLGNLSAEPNTEPG